MQLIHKTQTLGQPVPTIGKNGNWYIEGKNTGVKANAADMVRGKVNGSASALDALTEPGIYYWWDTEMEWGSLLNAGREWLIIVERYVYSNPTRISYTQLAVSGMVWTGDYTHVRVRSHFHEIQNDFGWSEWKDLANTDMMSHANLIKNWYFPHPLNTRNKRMWSFFPSDSNYSGTYLIDGWRFCSEQKVTNNRAVALTPNGLQFTAPQNTADYISRIFYPLNEAGIWSNALIGCPVTLSILTANGQFASKVIHPARTDTIWDGEKYSAVTDSFYCTLYKWSGLCGGTPGVLIINQCANSDGTMNATQGVVKAVKLEIGDHQTLVCQDATYNTPIALNDPPPDDAELRVWSRRTLITPDKRMVYAGNIGADGNLYLTLPTANSEELRATPTIAWLTSLSAFQAEKKYFDCNGVRYDLTGDVVTEVRSSSTGVCLNLNPESDVSKNCKHFCGMFYKNSATIHFLLSAEV